MRDWLLTAERFYAVTAMGTEREREIAQGFQRGESWAFEAAAREYFQNMVHFVTHLIHDRERAVDLTQEAFYLACRAHYQVDPARSMAPWLFQIARNIAYKDHNRRKKRAEVSIEPEKDGDSPMEFADLTADPRNQTTENEALNRIHALIDRLKPKYKDVLILRVIEGLSGEETSKLLRIPVATVNTRSHRALQELRRLARLEGLREDELFS
ncbi:MAG: sigma-70 family RNA polymerase sigma factor [bacterium]|nr:sigma-70 family RNA polymerase sigma factor [bacterium]